VLYLTVLSGITLVTLGKDEHVHNTLMKTEKNEPDWPLWGLLDGYRSFIGLTS